MSTQINYRRVIVIAAALVLAGWMIFDPFTVFGNIYEMFLIAVIAAVYAILRYRGQIQSVSLLAIISASCAIFNPAVVNILFRILALPSVGHGDSEWRSFRVALIAVVTGHIALRRIRRTVPPLRGRVLAWIGVILGYVWIIGWIAFFAAFLRGMSGWH
jgi:hypothetical protein